MKIDYRATDERDIDLIKGLWEKLNRHHRDRSTYFAGHYARWNFEERKKDLLARPFKAVRVDLARDKDSARLIGYCVSTMLTDSIAEIDSIYIERKFRSLGIGEKLVERALKWMDGRQIKRRTLQVAVGNEEVFGFYGRFRFYPKRVTLEQVPDKPAIKPVNKKTSPDVKKLR